MADHHVNRVTLDFVYKKEAEENALQKTKAFFYDKALPALSHVLDDVQQDLYLDKLEIDVGVTSPDDFTVSFQRALAKALGRLNPHPANFASSQPQGGRQAAAEPLFFYLRKGYWPWNYQRKSEAELEAYVDVFFKTEDATSTLLQQISQEEAFVATRFLYLELAKKKRWQQLIRGLQKRHPVFERWLFSASEEILPQARTPASFYHRLVLFLLQSLPIKTASDTRQWLAELLTTLPALTATATKQLLTGIRRLHGPSLQLQLPEVLNQMKVYAENTSRGSVEETGPYPPKASAQSTGQQDQEETEKINIANAGLILFHPFLPAVFEDLKWTDRTKRFVSRTAQQKAVLSLQYLLNGKSRQPEHTLVLNKLLCNWPLHMPVGTATKFSTREKTALAELSSSLREYWDILKNTSHRGLIESFVARPGLVQKTADGYLLQIERKTIDILLESLPFAINTIKLPWNEYLLYTEW